MGLRERLRMVGLGTIGLRTAGLGTAGLGMAVACVPNSNGAGGSGGATPASGEGDSGDSSSGGNPDPVATGADGSTSSPSDPTPTVPPGEGSSTGSTSAGADGPASDGTAATGQGSPPAQLETLGHADFANCSQPLWCFSNGDIMSPAGDGIWAQECFDVVMEPPFALVEFRTVIRGLSEEVDEVRLQVHERDAGEPGRVITERTIDASTLSLGENVIALDPPVVIDQPTVCLGLAAPRNDQAGALGISVDPSAEEPSVSYLRMNGQGYCNIQNWTDVIALAPIPSGNWCIQATVEEQ